MGNLPFSRRILVDHAFIAAGGEITKAANWVGNKLGQSKHSKILFTDREDIVNLFVVSTLPALQLPRELNNPVFDDPTPS